ncbi:MAG: hypothetical protein EYC70_00430 [Planctomycetota bacterium]|nr:MAG: hypothetical protein EYC70_00430 [Planctomycetota bacterium]
MATLTELTALEAAINRGAREVEFSDAGGTHKLRYHSLEEMLRIRDQMRQELGLTTAGRGDTMGVYDKGM